MEPLRPEVHHERARIHEPLTDEPLTAELARFGHAAFRPGQQEVVEAVLAGRDVLAVMPTGSGKSLGYQLPALRLPGLTLVVSPLVALMKDQVDELTRLGIPAAALHSLASPDERRAAIADARAGTLKLLYVAPERFAYEGFDRLLGELRVSRFAVDEAHCVSEWGHDFRPDYRRLKEAASRCRRADGEGRPPVVAVTATATPEVREDVAVLLGLNDPSVFVAGFDRPNLRLSVRRVSGPREKRALLPALVKEHRALVYAATRRSAEAAADALVAAGLSAAAYHAGLDDDTRTRVQDAFAAGTLRIVCATNAFGMGIDRPDISRVVHWELPGSLEAYYQEVGRAGRDGRPSEAVLLWNKGDIRTREFLLSREDEDDPRRDGMPIDPQARERRRELDRKKLRRMIDYAESAACLRGTILRYFGDPAAPEHCGDCGPCSRSRSVDDEELLLLRKVLSGVARGGERWGRRRIAAMLAGDLDALPDSLRGLTTTGLLREIGAKAVERWLDAAVAAGLLAASNDDYRTLSLTREGRDVMAGRSTDVTLTPPEAESSPQPRLRAPRLRVTRSGRGAASAADSLIPDDTAPSPDADRLLARLKVWRRGEATSRGIPAYTVFHDATLETIAAFRPLTLEALARISGVGPAKLERYGGDLLALLTSEG
ncbi:MAG TPA: ATP-dependent DNA helicase RecQ [Thermoanaerobaculia bacterium]|nr:ATP-dependent DNA helicase RecQ [Thermoanaerobaculia bacterium]